MNKWYKEAVFYHIYPFGLLDLPFYNDGQVNHKLKDLYKWLDHMHDLNIDALYLGPIFKSISHGYDTTDYLQIDNRLGTNEEFKEFVKYAHSLNIKVVVDGVFNHTGKEFFAFKDILSNLYNSHYINWYYIDFNGRAKSGEPFDFQTWSNYYELAKLNLDNNEVTNYLLDVITYWIKEFDIDGIRLDCADCLSFNFLKSLRQHTNNLKNDFWLMGELIHGDYSRFISNELLDSSTNYDLHKGLYSCHNQYNYFELAHTIKRQFDPMWGLYKGLYLYNFVDNHDVDRIASKLDNINNLKNIYVLLFTLIGIPSIYYGSEYQIEGKRTSTDDKALRPYLNLDDLVYNDITYLIKYLAKLKKEYTCLSYGEYKELYLTNRQYAYIRKDDKTLLIIANNDTNDISFNIDLKDSYTSYKSLLNKDTYNLNNNVIEVNLKANDSDIIELINL